MSGVILRGEYRAFSSSSLEGSAGNEVSKVDRLGFLLGIVHPMDSIK